MYINKVTMEKMLMDIIESTGMGSYLKVNTYREKITKEKYYKVFYKGQIWELVSPNEERLNNAVSYIHQKIFSGCDPNTIMWRKAPERLAELLYRNIEIIIKKDLDNSGTLVYNIRVKRGYNVFIASNASLDNAIDNVMRGIDKLSEAGFHQGKQN